MANFIGGLSLNIIDINRVEYALNAIRKNPRNGRYYSETTMNRVKSAFRSFFSWAYHNGHIKQDISMDIKPAKISANPTIPMNKDETDALLSVINASGDIHASRDKALFSVYAFTGIRKSEALKLKISDYDRFSSALKIRADKGGISRLQPVPARLKEILSKYLYELSLSEGLSSSQYLFPGMDRERPLSTRQVNKRFNKNNIRLIQKIGDYNEFDANKWPIYLKFYGKMKAVVDFAFDTQGEISYTPALEKDFFIQDCLTKE